MCMYVYNVYIHVCMYVYQCKHKLNLLSITTSGSWCKTQYRNKIQVCVGNNLPTYTIVVVLGVSFNHCSLERIILAFSSNRHDLFFHIGMLVSIGTRPKLYVKLWRIILIVRFCHVPLFVCCST